MTLKRLTDVRLAIFLPLLLLAGCNKAPQADIAFYGDNIITLSEQSESANFVAVKDDTIVFVGQRDDWDGQTTEVVNLEDSALLPGFIDAHGHVAWHGRLSAMVNIASPPVGPAEDMNGLVMALKSHIASKDLAEGDWVVGMGYDDSLLTEARHPTTIDLDKVSTSHPILLIHVSGHLSAVNSKALEIAGINEDTPNPPGGVIRREGDSQRPNGVLEETAGFAIQSLLPPAENINELVHAGLLDYARYGITTAQDGASSLGGINELRSAANEKPFPIDVVSFQMVDETYLGGNSPPLPILSDYKSGFKIGGVKMILDGSPQGKTAYLTQPYKIPPKGGAHDYRGYPIMPAESVDALFTKFIDAGLPILAHANGDAAADLFVNALNRSIDTSSIPDHRTVMIHAQTVREDQLDIMAELKAIPSFFSAHTFYWGDWHRDSVFGEERASRISPTQSSLDKGIVFTVHNDSPVVPPDMIRLLWATTNRLTRSGQVLGQEQRISTLDAIKAVTINAAYQYFEEDKKGTIDVGKQADFVILSKNPLNVPTTQLLDIKVERTIARGKTIFELNR